MKRRHWFLLTLLVAGLAGFAVMRWQSPAMTGMSPQGRSRLPELEWLRREFHLTEEQFLKTSELHLAYRPTCELLCSRVMASQEKVKRLAEAGRQVTPALEAALQEHAALHLECQTAMITHLYETAACLAPDQAKDYLAALLPHVIELSMEPAGH